HPPRPRRPPVPGQTPSPGTALRRPLQPARQPRRTNLGRAEELRPQHRRHLARTAQTDPLLLPQPLTGPDARRRRPLDQPLAAPGLRAELLECRLVARRCLSLLYVRVQVAQLDSFVVAGELPVDLTLV